MSEERFIVLHIATCHAKKRKGHGGHRQHCAKRLYQRALDLGVDPATINSHLDLNQKEKKENE